jgi:NAD(P)-dependent dehydrogenase (short-subunit alcohol dehydrogenase family)
LQSVSKGKERQGHIFLRQARKAFIIMEKPLICITGGSKGIGKALAERFHRGGWQVLACARGAEALASLAEALPGLQTYACDLADKEQVKAFGAHVLSCFGAPEVLVNNAGAYLPGELHREEDEVFERLMALNLASAYYLTKALLPSMIARRRGSIVNMSSVAGLQAYPNGGSYSISKFALSGFSRNLREELKPHNIRVLTLYPGAVFTASWEGADVEEERLMPTEDIAELLWAACALSERSVVEEMIIRPALGDL